MLNLDAKGKARPRTGRESPDKEKRDSSTMSLISALGGGVWSAQRSCCHSLPWRRQGTHCTGGWVGTRVHLDGCKNLASFLILSPDRPVRSTLEAQTLIGILQRVKLAIQPGYLSSAINSSEYDSSFSRLLIRPIWKPINYSSVFMSD